MLAQGRFRMAMMALEQFLREVADRNLPEGAAVALLDHRVLDAWLETWSMLAKCADRMQARPEALPVPITALTAIADLLRSIESPAPEVEQERPSVVRVRSEEAARNAEAYRLVRDAPGLTLGAIRRKLERDGYTPLESDPGLLKAIDAHARDGGLPTIRRKRSPKS